MSDIEQEKTKVIGGRTYKSVMYDLEYGYAMEELVLSVLGDTLGELFGLLDEADGATPAAAMGALASGSFSDIYGSASGINGDALGRAIGGTFRRLRAHGGFFKFARAVVRDTKCIDDAGKAKPIPFALMRGRYKDVEDLVWFVLDHNFRAYFLERVGEMMALSDEKSTEQRQEAGSPSAVK